MPSRKIIDDRKLLEMRKEGKSQKEISEFFKVSPVAISKRLKRLIPSLNSILDKYPLTDQQKSFVVQKAKGKTNTQAALDSYEVTSRKSAKAIGSENMAHPVVNMAYKDIMDNIGLSNWNRTLRIKDHVYDPDPNVSLKALDMTFKLDGSYKTEEDKTNNIVLISRMAVLFRDQMGNDNDYEEAIEIEAGN
jgi:hypothetical protein